MSGAARRHTLVVGGTGMLRDATLALARSCDVLTVVARTKRSSSSLARALEGASCRLHGLLLDWCDRRAFLAALVAHLARVGAPTLVLAWTHDDSLGLDVARGIAPGPEGCTFFHVRSSTAGSPTAGADALAAQFHAYKSLRYHQVILGFQREQAGSRWLHHAEIADGVLEAIAAQRAISIVGVVSPWNERP